MVKDYCLRKFSEAQSTLHNLYMRLKCLHTELTIKEQLKLISE